MILTLWMSLALGAERSVCAAGCDYDSVQAAVDAADPGDVITLGAGTYRGYVVVNKSLEIRGASGRSSLLNDDPNQPWVEGQGLVQIEQTGPELVEVTLDGLAIVSSRGAAVHTRGATVYAVGLSVSSTHFGDRGGAVVVDGGLLEVDAGVYSGGAAVYGGLIYAAPGSDVVLRAAAGELQLLNGFALEAGGAVFMEGTSDSPTSLVVDGASFRGNESALAGGAIALEYLDAVQIRGAFVDNRSLDGGAVHTLGGALELTGATFRNNVAAHTGGAVAGWGTSVVVDSSSFFHNEATLGGAAHFRFAADAEVRRSVFCGNRASDSNGALALLGVSSDFATASIRSSQFYDNGASAGTGALLVADMTVELQNNTIVANQAGAATDGMVALQHANGVVRNNLFVGSTSVAFRTNQSRVSFGYDGWWGNVGDISFEGEFEAEGVDSSGDRPFETTGIFADPGFRRVVLDGRCAQDDFHIDGCGPAYAAGDPALDGGGLPADLGAFGVDVQPKDIDGDACDQRYDCDDTVEGYASGCTRPPSCSPLDPQCAETEPTCETHESVCTTPWPVDLDGDGYRLDAPEAAMQDCDDSDATIHPGAPEVLGDAVDSNCDGFYDPVDYLVPVRTCAIAPAPGIPLSIPVVALLTFAATRRRRRF